MRYNPVKAKLAVDYRYLAFDLDPIPQRLKPSFLAGSDGGPEAPPLQKQGLAETEVPTLQKPGSAKPMGRAEVPFTSHSNTGLLQRNK